MAATPESKVKKQVVRILVAYASESGYNAYYFYPATGGYGKSGVADIITCLGGSFVAIECKAWPNKLTPLQQKNMLDVVKAKGVGISVDDRTLDKFAALLPRLGQFGPGYYNLIDDARENTKIKTE